MVAVSTQAAIAFRWAAHGLGERPTSSSLLDAAGRCGVQNSPPGAAALALNARVRDLRPGGLEDVVEKRSLLQTWCMRGSPYLFPATDAAVFTAGVLPPTEQGRQHLIPGIVPALNRLGMSLDDVVDRTEAVIREVLAGRQLAINELGAEVSGQIAPGLPPEQRAWWAEPGPYAAGQPLGEGVVHFALRILTLRQVICFGSRAGNKAPFVLVNEWLGHVTPAVEPVDARAELLRRYLRCYGPATRAGFASWVGVQVGDTDPWWDPIAAELTPVDFDGPAWVLTADLPALESPTPASGLRLLPPHDPYTQLHDRETIVDRRHHRAIWRTVGDPGTILVDGRIVGTWRARKTGKKLTGTYTTFSELSAHDWIAFHEEVAQISVLRGATSVEFRLEDSSQQR